jgi:hypothetical protein
VVAIMGILAVVSAPMIRSSSAAYSGASPLMLRSQEAAMALAHVSTALRQARAVTAAADNGAGVASLTFLGADGTAMVLSRQAGSNNLQYGPSGSTAVLAGDCTGLSIKCYTPGGTLISLPPPSPSGVGLVEIAATVVDPEGRGSPATYTTRAAIRHAPAQILITEIMYDPPWSLGSSSTNQWVELYNASSQPIDVGGWLLWTQGELTPDALQVDALYTSAGTTVIPPGGYAIVTDQDSDLYHECLSNGDFESSYLGYWQFSRNTYSRATGDTVSGDYKLQVVGGYTTTMYQDFHTPSGYFNPRLRLRAKLKVGTPSSSTLKIQVTDRWNNVVSTLYNGHFSAAWTEYAYDFSSFANQDLRLYVTVSSPGGSDRMNLDAITIYASRLPTLPYDCQHLWVDDNSIGSDLTAGQVFLSNGTSLRDVVSFSRAWGGNNDGSTLSRVAPSAPSTQAASWEPGPYGGTPAAAN